jgi:hypothetical protein
MNRKPNVLAQLRSPLRKSASELANDENNPLRIPCTQLIPIDPDPDPDPVPSPFVTELRLTELGSIEGLGTYWVEIPCQPIVQNVSVVGS